MVARDPVGGGIYGDRRLFTTRVSRNDRAMRRRRATTGGCPYRVLVLYRASRIQIGLGWEEVNDPMNMIGHDDEGVDLHARIGPGDLVPGLLDHLARGGGMHLVIDDVAE
jgi:hypothetical protein